MSRICVALVDPTRARFFTFARVTDDAGGLEQVAEPTTFVQYSFDGRDHQLARRETEFARTAMAAFRELIDEHGAQRAIVCAAPRMLGKLRAVAPGILPERLTLDALAGDFVRLPSAEVRSQLVAHGLLSPRSAPPQRNGDTTLQ
jgi:Protein required for attachment to host cells